MSDVTRRISRWKAKYSPDIAAQTTARIFDDMTARYEASMVALNSMELDTKQVLSASGIDTVLSGTLAIILRLRALAIVLDLWQLGCMVARGKDGESGCS